MYKLLVMIMVITIIIDQHLMFIALLSAAASRLRRAVSGRPTGVGVDLFDVDECSG
jgi:hypothetical protein